MTILGASGVYVNNLNNGVIKTAIDTNVATSMFEMFKYLSNSGFLQIALSIVAVIAIINFFISSSDSGSLVVSSLTSGGLETPPKDQRIFWALIEGLIAISILLIGGEKALITIQSAVVILGLPFSIILLMIIVSMSKELKQSYVKYNYNENVTLKRKLKKIDQDAKLK